MDTHGTMASIHELKMQNLQVYSVKIKTHTVSH